MWHVENLAVIYGISEYGVSRMLYGVVDYMSDTWKMSVTQRKSPVDKL
jgi:hypothetical protein